VKETRRIASISASAAAASADARRARSRTIPCRARRWEKRIGRTVGSGDSGNLPTARVYSPGELSRVLEKQIQARLGAYSITGLELEGMLGEIGEDRGYARIYRVYLADAAGGTSFELSLPHGAWPRRPAGSNTPGCTSGVT
jgi:hypothetical protein